MLARSSLLPRLARAATRACRPAAACARALTPASARVPVLARAVALAFATALVAGCRSQVAAVPPRPAEVSASSPDGAGRHSSGEAEPTVLAMRLVFSCMPVGCAATSARLADLAQALGVQRFRTSTREQGAVVDLDGPSTERFRSAAISALCLEVHRVCDEHDPLSALATTPLPVGVSWAEESVPLGPDTWVHRRYAVGGNEAPGGAGAALRALLGAVEVPAGTHLAVGALASGAAPLGVRSYLLADEPLVGCERIADARRARSPDGRSVVTLTFDSEGARRFAEATAANVQRRLALVADGVVYAAPIVLTPIPGGSAQLFAGDDATEAEVAALAARIQHGRWVHGLQLLVEERVEVPAFGGPDSPPEPR